MDAGIEVIQDVRVFSVTEDGESLHVDVYGGSVSLCASVRFVLADDAERSHMARVLHKWCAAATPLTYIKADSDVALQNDAAVFGPQMVAAD